MVGQKRQSQPGGGSKPPAFLSTYRGWRERTKENHAFACHQCGALKQHPGLTCKQVERRLHWSAAHQYDRVHPWDWPPEEIYAVRWGQWEHDHEA